MSHLVVLSIESPVDAVQIIQACGERTMIGYVCDQSQRALASFGRDCHSMNNNDRSFVNVPDPDIMEPHCWGLSWANKTEQDDR